MFEMKYIALSIQLNINLNAISYLKEYRLTSARFCNKVKDRIKDPDLRVRPVLARGEYARTQSFTCMIFNT